MDRLIIDVREPSEYASGHYLGAINIPPYELENGTPALRTLPKNTPILVYCRSGSRSEVAIHILREQGFTNLTNGINKDYVAKLLAESP